MVCERLQGPLTFESGSFRLDGRNFQLVDGPLARGGTRLVELLEQDVEAGESSLTELVQAVRDSARASDNVLYRLAGATPETSTPMQYGGHFLERDRELLSEITQNACVVLYVQGGDGVYVDFVSDLPAHLFAWNAVGSGIDSADVRAMRLGQLGCEDGDADVYVDPTVIEALEKLSIG